MAFPKAGKSDIDLGRGATAMSANNLGSPMLELDGSIMGLWVLWLA
jgi:hypothetical protein